MRRLGPTVLLSLLALPGCADLLGPGAVEARRPLQTDRSEYTLQRLGGALEGEIPFTYTNRTGRTVYVVNCLRVVPPVLQKREDGAWVDAWSAVVPHCLSPPIVIEAGGTWTDTLRVVAFDSERANPSFRVEEVAGVYRMRWPYLVHDFDVDRNDLGDRLPLEATISNQFQLRVDSASVAGPVE